MPYEDERAGLAAIRAIAESGIVDDFRDQMQDRHSGEPLPLPPFMSCPQGTSRTHILAIDGSNIYEQIPGALPCTEAGLVSLGIVLIDLQKLGSLQRLPESRAVNPRLLRDTEKGQTLGMMLPGQNAEKKDGTSPRTWFRQTLNSELEKAHFGGETLADTLHHLLHLGARPTINYCPNQQDGCEADHLPLPAPGEQGNCHLCGEVLLPSDGLRIHEQFIENASPIECHNRVQDTLELLALVNSLRYLAQSEKGLTAISHTAFVMDGQLAALGTIAVLGLAIRKELHAIQKTLQERRPGANLLVMSGVKSGPFVEHAAELDRAPAPNKRIPPAHMWLPNNAYIRANIIARSSQSNKPWGEYTHFGRPVVLKTDAGQRLVFNIAQPELDPTPDDEHPITSAPPPQVLADAIATASPLGLGTDQFLALRRAHSQAAIPLRAGTDLIKSLAP